MKSLWWPESNMVGVLIKRGGEDTDTHRGKAREDTGKTAVYTPERELC